MSDIFQISRSGLQTASRATDVVAKNIANVNTPGYSRQKSIIQPGNLNPSSGINVGLGVNVAEVQRMRDLLVDQQIQNKESELGDLSQRIRVFEMLERSLVSDTGTGLDVLMGDFFNSFSAMASDPSDMSLRRVAVSNGQSLTNSLNGLDQRLSELSELTLQTASNQTNQLNTILGALAGINNALVSSQPGTQSYNLLLDQQAQNLKQLSTLADVDVNNLDKGRIEVRMNGSLILSNDGFIPANLEIDRDNSLLSLRLDNGRLISPQKGELAANIALYNTELSSLKSNLDGLAASLVESVNEIHRNGFGLRDDLSRDFFEVLNGTGRSAGTIKISADISADPGLIATSTVAGEQANSNNAIRIANLLAQPDQNGRTLIDRSIEIISQPGMRLNEMNIQREVLQATREMLASQQDQISGVSMDEELGLLIKFQNAYQASARVMNVARDMQDTLLSLV